MADGFKKIFNGTTLAGRANVAKATYATIALIYIIFRARRKSPEPPKGTEDPTEIVLQEQYEPEPRPEKREKDCAVCRERVRKSDEPPPPPPPERRNCKCEEAPAIQLPLSPHQKQSQTCSGPEPDSVHPTSELISQMQESASRVLRNVIGAVMGERVASVTSDDNNNNSCNDEHCSCCTPSEDVGGSAADMDQVDDEGCDYETSNQLFNSSQRRTAPRHCGPEPTNASNNNPEMTLNPEQVTIDPQTEAKQQVPFRCFDDDFASEIFFGDE